MRKKIYVLLLVLLATRLSVGKNGANKTDKRFKQKNITDPKTKTVLDRERRSLMDDEDKPFWANRGKKQSEEEIYGQSRFTTNTKFGKTLRSDEIDGDTPFWGNRGRRDSSEENFVDSDGFSARDYQRNSDPILNYFYQRGIQSRRDAEGDPPFWGNRGRRNSDEDTSPFWGNRGRRNNEEPFWGARGRREELPFWGNRGRRDSFLFDEDSPFWGNRGRRRDAKDNLYNEMRGMEDDIDKLYKGNPSLWKNIGRQSSLKHLFQKPKIKPSYNSPSKKAARTANTLLDGRMYAEEPHYIIVERSSRSSGEDDPFFITRGKKENYFDWERAARDRRGAIEDLFKSVKTDPYFIARGKKDSNKHAVKINNSTVPYEDLAKAKELMCSTLELIIMKNNDNKTKREVDDRGRRAVLQKLAAQLQNDPYFVSRGKKDSSETEQSILDFVTEIAEMCD